MIRKSQIIKRDIESKKNLFVNNNIKNQIPFKILSDGKYHLNNATFKYLIKKVFANLQNFNSPHYVDDDQWLLLAFKKLFLEKPNLLIPIYQDLNNFYKIYPFNLENTFSDIISNFFKKHRFETTIINNSQNLKIIAEKGINEFAQKIFYQPFLKHIKENLKLKKSTSFTTVFQDALRSRIEKIIKAKIGNFDWNKYQNLNNWISNFDYQSAKILNAQNIYDQFFANSNTLQKIDMIKNDFKINYLANYFDQNLNYQQKVSVNESIMPMAQVFLHYLFKDLIANKKIKSVKVWTKEHAILIKFLSERMANGKLNIFEYNCRLFSIIINLFPNLWDFMKKFNLKFKANNMYLVNPSSIIDYQNLKWLINNNFGISIDNIILSLAGEDKLESNLQIGLKFVTNFVPQSLTDAPNTNFNIKIVKVKNGFSRAKKLIGDFLEDNLLHFKKPHFLNASSITEKELVEGISTIKNHKDMLGNNLNSSEKIKNKNHFSVQINGSDLETDWNHLFLTKLSELSDKLSKINSPYYKFKLKLVPTIYGIHSKQKGISKFENLSINFKIRLIQEPKNSNSGWPIRFRHFTNLYNNTYIYLYDNSQESEHKQKVLMMIDVIKESINKKFPQGLTFASWKTQKKSFWKEEFLDKDGNYIKFNNLKSKNDLIKRSNLPAIKNYLRTILAEIKKYRDNFIFKENYSIYEDFKTKQQIIKLEFVIRDESTNQEFVLSVKEKLMSLQDKNYQYNNKDFDFLKSLKPVSKLTNEEKIMNIPLRDDFTFLYKGKKITFFEIKQKLESYGLKMIRKSMIKDIDPVLINYDKKWGSPYYVQLFYELEYHNFYSGKKVKKVLFFRIFLTPINSYIGSAQIESKYNSIINNLSLHQRKNKKFMEKINTFFGKLKDPITKKWKNKVKKKEFNETVTQVENFISQFQGRDIQEIIEKLKKIYGNNIPQKVFNKIFDSDYHQILEEILEQREKIGNNNIKKILENDKFFEFLKNQKINKVKSFILDFIKVTEKNKYAYFGIGVGFVGVGFLSLGASIWSMKINKQSKTMNLKFKRNKYLSIMTLVSTLLSITIFVIFMILFFINKGGF